MFVLLSNNILCYFFIHFTAPYLFCLTQLLVGELRRTIDGRRIMLLIVMRKNWLVVVNWCGFWVVTTLPCGATHQTIQWLSGLHGILMECIADTSSFPLTAFKSPIPVECYNQIHKHLLFFFTKPVVNNIKWTIFKTEFSYLLLEVYNLSNSITIQEAS